MKTIFHTTLIVFAIQIQTYGQGDESSYHAYLNSNQKALWKTEVTTKATQSKGNIKAQFSLALSQLGLLSATMADKDEDLFDEYYDAAVENLEALIKSDKNWAEPKAVLSAVYGLKMAYSPIMGMFLGPKSSSLIEKAMDQAPQSALVWKYYANSKFFTPEMFGGDLNEAIESYEKCIAVYESNPVGLRHNWLYLDALAFMGQAYLKNGDKEKAQAAFEKALKVEPEFSWVKYSLLPKSK